MLEKTVWCSDESPPKAASTMASSGNHASLLPRFMVPFSGPRYSMRTITMIPRATAWVAPTVLGLGAACGAAKLGVRTLLVERYGFPGGVATVSCCPYLMGFAAGGRPVVKIFCIRGANTE